MAGAVRAGFAPPGPETLAAAYYLYGDDRLHLDRALKAIRKAVHPEGFADLATDVVDVRDAGQAAASSIVNACRTVPLLARRRLVLVRSAENLDAEAGEVILDYLASPSPSSCLVLIGGEKIDGRLRFFAKLRSAGVLHAFEPAKNMDSGMALLRAEAQDRGVTLDPAAERALLEAVGQEPAQLASAVERLALYVAPATRISMEAVDAVVIATRPRTVFELCKAVGQGSLAGALRCASELDPGEEPPVKVLFMLARHMRQLWLTKALLAKRADKFEIARVAGLPPFAVPDLMEQARGFDAAGLERGFAILFEADRLLKSSRTPARVVLDRALFDLCALRRGRPAAQVV